MVRSFFSRVLLLSLLVTAFVPHLAFAGGPPVSLQLDSDFDTAYQTVSPDMGKIEALRFGVDTYYGVPGSLDGYVLTDFPVHLEGLYDENDFEAFWLVNSSTGEMISDYENVNQEGTIEFSNLDIQLPLHSRFTFSLMFELSDSLEENHEFLLEVGGPEDYTIPSGLLWENVNGDEGNVYVPTAVISSGQFVLASQGGSDRELGLDVASCSSPYVPYLGECVDPIPACRIFPAHGLPSSCIDKISNGYYLEHYTFSCAAGYVRSGYYCVPDQLEDEERIPEIRIGTAYLEERAAFTTQPEIQVQFCNDGDSTFDQSINVLTTVRKNDGQFFKSHTSTHYFEEFTHNVCAQRRLVTLADLGVNEVGDYTAVISADYNDLVPEGDSEINVFEFDFGVEAEVVEFVETLPPAGYEDEVLVNTVIYENPFPDTDMDSVEGRAAAELYRRAVIGGFPDGEFKGSRSVNRAEAAKFLLLARHGNIPEISNNSRFPDVMDSQWYTRYVVAASVLGVIDGHPDGLFRPGNTVNTAEFLKMLTLNFELDTNLSHSYRDVYGSAWYSKYAGIAERYELFPDRHAYYLDADRELTRDEVAVAIYQYLSNR